LSPRYLTNVERTHARALTLTSYHGECSTRVSLGRGMTATCSHAPGGEEQARWEN